MHGEGFFFQAFVYLAAAVISVPLAKRLGLGSVLGYLLAGVVIGPFGLHLIGEEGQDVLHFAEFGVVMMLFLIGLELEPDLLWRLRVPILGLGGLQVVLSAAAIAGLGAAFGLAWREAVAVGLILALSSTAIVLQTLAEKGLMKTDAGQNAFSVLLFQDLAVIPMLALLPFLAPAAVLQSSDGSQNAGDHAATWAESLPPWGQALAVLGAVVLVIVGGRFLTRPIFRWIAAARLREIFTASALLLVIGIALLMAKVGLSPALGTFLAGVVLANSEYRHQLEGDVEPFKGLLLGLFFIAVGASIDFQLIGDEPLQVGAIVVALVVIKLAILGGLGKVFGMRLDQNLLFTFALAQGGEFAFVLVSFAVQQGIFGDAVAAPLIAAVAISMALTPLLLVSAEKFLLPRVGTKQSGPRRAPDKIDSEGAVIIAGFGRCGRIIGRLLRANGVRPTVLEIDSEKVDLLRRLGLDVYYGDATRLDLLIAAGAERARLLILTLDNNERILQIADTAREHFPHLQVLACADDRSDAYELLDAGIDNVYRKTLDTSLKIGVDTLRALGFRAHQATRSAHKFRCHDEATLRELADLRHDEGTYLNRARQRIHDLETLLQSELESAPEGRDEGWDVESLRKEFGGESAS